MRLTEEHIKYIEELWDSGLTNKYGICSCLIQFKGVEIHPGKLRSLIEKEISRFLKRRSLK